MAVAATRRMPGIGFEVKASQPAEILPRMDIAAFVGFASSGPLHIPVVVESVTEFVKVFGQDAPLAWDEEKGETIRAYLAPAVRAFFLNGGERCWVIRVADEKKAKYNYFPIPGLAFATVNSSHEVELAGQAFARARCEGSWSDFFEVGASFAQRSVDVLGFELDFSAGRGLPTIKRLVLRPFSTGDIRIGDLLHFTFPDSDCSVMAHVQAIDSPSTEYTPGLPLPPGTDGRTPLLVRCGAPLWFRTKLPDDEMFSLENACVRMFRHNSDSSPIEILHWLRGSEDTLTLFLDPLLGQPPRSGSVIKVESGSTALWMTVDEYATTLTQESPPRESVAITGRCMLPLSSQDFEEPVGTPSCSILTLELSAGQPDNVPAKLAGLGFDTSHELFWGFLPTDEELFSGEVAPIPPGSHPYSLAKSGPDAQKEERKAGLSSQLYLRQLAADPRFPIAGPGDDSIIFFPVSVPGVASYHLGAENDGSSPLERDGLSEFGESLFVDEDIASGRTIDLISTADFIRYQSPTPRKLRGVYAALAIEEATILAVPDAVHRSWIHAAPALLTSPPGPSFIPRPEHSRCPEENSSSPDNQSKKKRLRDFLDCPVGRVEAPELKVGNVSASGDWFYELETESGSFVLEWSETVGVGESYVLEESCGTEFTSPTIVYSGVETKMKMYGRSSGEYFYRVRALASGETSDWSNGVTVRIGAAHQWVLSDKENYSESTLLSVHRSLIRLCASRGDLLAILSVPSHYREEDAIKYSSSLKSVVASYLTSGSVEPLGSGEADAFSYAALYHPWPVAPVEDETGIIRAVPPDGAVCGTVAGRALARGAWISPANEIMSGIVSLSPVIGATWRSRFQDAQINLLRREPQGFLCMSADTLDTDEDLRQINVRRLLSLLRRLAIRDGAAYVFEPNNDAFQRRVQRGFESMMNYMYQRGAFKGASPEEAYRVVTGGNVAVPGDIDKGQFAVELRVAPSLPMRFLTVRLVLDGDRLSAGEG